MVLKHDGRREEFSKEKLLSGIKKACQKRPISPKVIEDLVEKIVNEVTDKYEREVPAEVIGKLVMEGLRAIDEVAYVRFASVYRRFQEATDFVHEVKKLEGEAMITLGSDCLLFEMATGESIPCSADMVCVELADGTGELFDAEFVHHATKAVFHYFKHELGRQAVSASEFAGALEKVLRGFAVTAQTPTQPDPVSGVLESDLCRLAHESGQGRELFFFPRLRAELQRHLQQAPRVLRFRGLRGCVKQLTGARRWNRRCQSLEGEIVDLPAPMPERRSPARWILPCWWSRAGNIRMSKTLFEKIIARELPGTIVYEDDQVVAFRDIRPQAPVHVLIVPRKPIPRIAEAEPGRPAGARASPAEGGGGGEQVGADSIRFPAGVQQRPGRRRSRAAPALPYPRRPPPGLAARLSAIPTRPGSRGTPRRGARCLCARWLPWRRRS